MVNALLTQVDGLKSRPNAMVLTTSNITEAIDLAFVDRADIKAYIGPPGLEARYEILRSAVEELCRRGLVQAEGGGGGGDRGGGGGLEGEEESRPAQYGSAWKERIEAAAAAAAGGGDGGGGGGVSVSVSLSVNAKGGRQEAATAALARAAATCEGLSGRALRKLPFLAYASAHTDARCPLLKFLHALFTAARDEFKDRENLHSG